MVEGCVRGVVGAMSLFDKFLVLELLRPGRSAMSGRNRGFGTEWDQPEALHPGYFLAITLIERHVLLSSFLTKVRSGYPAQ